MNITICDKAGNVIKTLELTEDQQRELKLWSEFQFPACYLVLEEYPVSKLKEFLSWYKINRTGGEVLRVMSDPAFTAWYRVHGTYTGRAFLKVLRVTTWFEALYEKLFYWRRKITWAW
jgi:hypothetical protein